MNLYPKDISKEILQMAENDMKQRNELAEEGKLDLGYNPEMEDTHLENSYRLEKIIKEFGYPTWSKTTRDVHNAAWLIIQHAISRPDFMRACYKLFTEDLVGDVEARNIAYLGDRIAFYERRPQRYGTQFDYDLNGKFGPWIIADPSNVDKYRMEIGLPSIGEVMEKYGEDPKMKMQIPKEEAIEARSAMEKWLKEVGWAE